MPQLALSQGKHWTSLVCTCYLGITVKQVSCNRFNVSSGLFVFEEVESWILSEHTNNTRDHRKRTSVTTVLPNVASKILNTSENNHT
jgi:hypothetical protein